MISRPIKLTCLLFHYIVDCRKLLNKRHISVINKDQFFFQHLQGYPKLHFLRSEVKKKNEEGENWEKKKKLIDQLNFRSVEDAMPFYDLPYNTLLKICQTTKNDQSKNFCMNRIYYISDKIMVKPSILSEKISKRTFIYSLSFDWLEKSLSVLIEFGVPAERILTDLWVLKYHHETIRHRLQKVKDLGKDDLYPWMVRCKKDILNRSIKISRDTKSILGDNVSLQSYLASRLNTSPEVIANIFEKLPAIKRMRVTKAKDFIDFLLNNGFTEQDIIDKPRVLTASIKTVNNRLSKLKEINMSCINLNILCRSRKDFKKYYATIVSIMEKEHVNN